MRLATLALVLTGAAGIASGGELDAELAKAQLVRAPEGLGSLFWAQTASCREGSDLDRRQCTAVRDARSRAVVERTYVTTGDLVVSLGDYDIAKGGLPYTVRACLSCTQAVKIDGERRFVTGRGTSTIKGGAIVAPELAKGVVRVSSAEAAKHWREVALPRLEAQVLFRIPPKLAAWSQGQTRGVQVDVLAVRVFDPCDGAIVHASMTSDPISGDPSRCAGGSATLVEKPKVVEPVETGPKLPDKLSTAAIQAAIAPLRPEIQKCLEIYGIPGDARVTLDIGGSGKVDKATLKGEFEDTPTGECILKVVQGMAFPPFKSKSMTIRNVPFILR